MTLFQEFKTRMYTSFTNFTMGMQEQMAKLTDDVAELKKAKAKLHSNDTRPAFTFGTSSATFSTQPQSQPSITRLVPTLTILALVHTRILQLLLELLLGILLQALLVLLLSFLQNNHLSSLLHCKRDVITYIANITTKMINLNLFESLPMT